MLSMQAKHYNSDKVWWNKLNQMTDAEFKMLPYGFVKKYGSIMDALAKQRAEMNLDRNINNSGYYSQIKNLQTLKTDEEKAADQRLFEISKNEQIVTQAELVREDGDYMRRQPRIDHSKLSYNFEQFRDYTKFFKEAKARDDQASQKFYKLVKYVK